MEPAPFEHEKNMAYKTAMAVNTLVWQLFKEHPPRRGVGRLRQRIDAASLRIVVALAEAGVSRTGGARLYRTARQAAAQLLLLLETLHAVSPVTGRTYEEIRQLTSTLASLPRHGPRRELPGSG